MPTASVLLKDLRFFAFHGLYEGEKVLGNDFLVNLEIGYTPKQFPVQHIEDTIDYAAVYQLVKSRMNIPTPLLETLVSDIASEILAQFSLSDYVRITIEKMRPPVPQFTGNLGVSLTLNREEI
ncbi:dihydroneopterin aldolase [Sediminibacterium sp.]|uniref:dihydroneopterin aldolase n=1 Tax=Sediminibacterium sp. TaxID=1917865 RepID=UPI003F6A2006